MRQTKHSGLVSSAAELVLPARSSRCGTDALLAAVILIAVARTHDLACRFPQRGRWKPILNCSTQSVRRSNTARALWQ